MVESRHNEHVAFVAGATGYTGRAVVAALCDAGCRTYAHVRPDSSRLQHWRDTFDAVGAHVDSTPWREDAMRERLAELEPTLVFALLGTTRRRARAEAAQSGAEVSYATVDYGLTSLLYRAASALPSDGHRAPRFIYLSSAGVRPSKPGSYLHARWKMEQELMAGTLPYVIARPSFITGPGRDDDRPGERIGAKVSNALLAAAGVLGAATLRDRYQSMDNHQLGRALVRAALDVDCTDRILHADALRAL